MVDRPISFFMSAEKFVTTSTKSAEPPRQEFLSSQPNLPAVKAIGVGSPSGMNSLGKLLKELLPIHQAGAIGSKERGLALQKIKKARLIGILRLVVEFCNLQELPVVLNANLSQSGNKGALLSRAVEPTRMAVGWGIGNDFLAVDSLN